MLIPEKHIELLLMPVCAAQLFVVVFIYMIIVRRRMSDEFKLYLRFLGAFIFFLIARPIQEFTTPFLYALSLHTRIFSALCYRRASDFCELFAGGISDFKNRPTLLLHARGNDRFELFADSWRDRKNA